MGNFQLYEEARSDVLRVVQSLRIGASAAFVVSADLCARISASLDAYLTEAESRVDPVELARELRSLTQLVLALDPSVGLIRRHVADLSDPVADQIADRAFRLSAQIPTLSDVGSDLRGWAKRANSADLVLVLRLCLVEGGAMVPGRRRLTGRQSAAHFEPVIFGRGRGVSIPKHNGGRPTDGAEVRLIAHLAIDWLISTGVQPEGGRDGHTAFSGLVHDVFGWIGIENKAQHCLRQYWKLTKVKRPKRW